MTAHGGDMQATELLTVEEVAARLKVHPDTVRRWLRGGTLAGVRLGGERGSWRIREADVERLLEAGQRAS